MTNDELIEFERLVRAGEVKLWHGGAPGRLVGELLLPPSRTGAIGMGEQARRQGAAKVVSLGDRVYLTTNRDLARAVAANWAKRFPDKGRGSVYGVSLTEDGVEFDLDLPLGPFESFQVGSARVESIVDMQVDPDDPRHVRTLTSFIARIPKP